MKIAYLILSHHYPEQLSRMINALISEGTLFFVHVDLKTDIQPYHQLLNTDQVEFIAERVKVYWSKYSIVEAELNLIRAALKTDADYFVLLSGVDYPIVSNSEIHAFFEGNGYEYFSSSFLGSGGWEAAAARYQRFYVDQPWLQKIIDIAGGLIPKRKMPDHLRPYGGATWWNLTRDCCEYVLNYAAAHPNIMKFYSYTNCPDEMFFQTTILNSPFSERVVNNDLRYVDWSDCAAGKSFSPNLLTKVDFEKICKSGKLFARKFDASVDWAILDMIDQIR
jgi:hypothetical protein